MVKIKPKILIDSREKTPFNFDGDSDVIVSVSGLKSGDYTLENFESIIVIERKANVDELLGNFFYDKKRIFAEMQRLQDVKYRFIVIEQDLADILNPNSYYINISRKNRKSPMMPVSVVLNGLLELMFKFNIQIIFAGSKGKDITKKLLLRAYKEHG